MAVPTDQASALTTVLQQSIVLRQTVSILPALPPAVATLRADTIADLNTIILRINTHLNANL